MYYRCKIDYPFRIDWSSLCVDFDNKVMYFVLLDLARKLLRYSTVGELVLGRDEC